MKFYTFGEKENPAILLLPGTCMNWKANFGHVIDGLKERFYVVCVSYDGFDEREDTVFPDMLAETAKIEEYIKTNFGGRLHAAYGCSLGGSFVSLLIARRNIHISHGIIGSSDMDQMPKPIATVMTKLVLPIFYKMIHTGELPDKMKKKMAGKDPEDATVKMMELMGIGKGGMPYVKRKSMENQFCTDLSTKVGKKIHADGTTIHVFYAKKMEKPGKTTYLERYKKHFANPDIVEYDLQHEELLICYPEKWVAEVTRVCEMKNG